MRKNLMFIIILLLPIYLQAQIGLSDAKMIYNMSCLLKANSCKIDIKPLNSELIKIPFNTFPRLARVDTFKIERDPIKLAEKLANKNAQKVLKTGRIMALKEKSILPGTCWTYINAVYNRAGFSKDRYYVFKSKKNGPYANTDSIKAGDWLYYINHSYRNIDHSGIFVHWVDEENRIALILSYTGRYKKKPATYKTYKLDNVFFITRAGRKEEATPTLTANLINMKNTKKTKS